MNIIEKDILNCLIAQPFANQRALSETSGYSLGAVNKSLHHLCDNGYLNASMLPTKKAISAISSLAPKRAVILAAGFGMRMVPINNEIPKGLLEVRGEVLIERLIRQLQESGVKEIYVVVGFLKEQFEYLIDEYGVVLIVNRDYSSKNNLHSLYLAKEHLENCYIVPSDIWAESNPFSKSELYSWYLVSDLLCSNSSVKINRKRELLCLPEKELGNAMIGIAYLLPKDAAIVKAKLAEMDSDEKYISSFWEASLLEKNRFLVPGKVVSNSGIAEINTFEQLRELDADSNHLRSDAIDVICTALSAYPDEITDIKVLKKGMTNRSFCFNCRGEKYIMRIPGEGTDQLINREEEAAVYYAISSRGICDDVVYIDPGNGYKITKFIENARVCDAYNDDDIAKSMKRLRDFHELGLKVEQTFDIFDRIIFYESLRGDTPSVYKDYEKTKNSIFSLKTYISKHEKPYALTHIDAVPDNFLFFDKEGKEMIKLIDWEYAGMQDQDVDIAMFCIYALYDRPHVDKLISLYYPEGCSDETRIKIYCYIAACGLLWSNWCEYKRKLGVEFGEYALRQYRYAKDYFRIVSEELQNEPC